MLNNNTPFTLAMVLLVEFSILIGCGESRFNVKGRSLQFQECDYYLPHLFDLLRSLERSCRAIDQVSVNIHLPLVLGQRALPRCPGFNGVRSFSAGSILSLVAFTLKRNPRLSFD